MAHLDFRVTSSKMFRNRADINHAMSNTVNSIVIVFRFQKKYILLLIEWRKNIGYYFKSYSVCKLITIKLTMKINLNTFYKFKERVNIFE